MRRSSIPVTFACILLAHGTAAQDPSERTAYTVIRGDRSRTDSRVDITENGRPVAGTFLMPPVAEIYPEGLRLYDTPLQGISSRVCRLRARPTKLR